MKEKVEKRGERKPVKEDIYTEINSFKIFKNNRVTNGGNESREGQMSDTSSDISR